MYVFIASDSYWDPFISMRRRGGLACWAFLVALLKVYGIFVGAGPLSSALWEPLGPIHFYAQARWFSILGPFGGFGEAFRYIYGCRALRKCPLGAIGCHSFL